MSHKRNTVGVLNYSKKKSQDALLKVDTAIKNAIKEKTKINFNTIANSANVSKGFLYNNKELRMRIEILRKQQESVTSTKSVKYNMEDNSKDTLIEALRYKIIDLETKNKKLIEENETLLNKLYEAL